MKSIIRLALCALLFTVFVPQAGAITYDSTGNPNDMPSGTVLTHLATFETLSFRDPAGTLMTTVEPTGNRTDTVIAEYGFSGPGTPADNTVSPGDVVWTYYCSTNEGNANSVNANTISFRFDEYGGASGWNVQAWINNTIHATLTPGVSDVNAGGSSNDNSQTPYAYRVQVTTEAAGAPNGSYIVMVTTVESSSTPIGKYTGGNAYTYGGWATATDQAADQTSAPILTLTRSSTVDAPTAAAGYTGGIHDAVPGSVITFTLAYSNTGSASAESVIIVDKVPTNTKLAHFNGKGTGTSRNVNLTAAQGNGTGWTIYYSKLANPSKVYGNTADWSGGNGGTIGTLSTGAEQFPNSNTTYVTGDDAYLATWIKWEKASIATTEDDKSLIWGATIR